MEVLKDVPNVGPGTVEPPLCARGGQHSRRLIAQALTDKYADLAQTGWQVSRAEVERDVQDLFGGAFERFCHN